MVCIFEPNDSIKTLSLGIWDAICVLLIMSINSAFKLKRERERENGVNKDFSYEFKQTYVDTRQRTHKICNNIFSLQPHT